MKPSMSLVEQWQARLERIAESRRLDPTYEWAWQWDIEAKVLHFLISRYAFQYPPFAVIPAPQEPFLSPVVFIPPPGKLFASRERKKRLRHIHQENEMAHQNQALEEPGMLERFASWTPSNRTFKDRTLVSTLLDAARHQGIKHDRQEAERERRDRERTSQRW